MNDSNHPAVSPAAIGLGYLAIVPFVCGAALVWLVDAADRPLAAQMLSAYAAVVVSFVGAIHWGIGFTQERPASRLFVWGIVPALVACLAVLMRPPLGLVVHAVMLVACYLVDCGAYPGEGVAIWLPLRFRWTIAATLACLVGAVGAWR